MDSVKYKLAARLEDVCFETGRSHSGYQFILGLQLPELVLIRFDASGKLESFEVRPIRIGMDAVEALQEWEQEISFSVGMIELCEFFIEERIIGISVLPDYLQEVIDDPASVDHDRRIVLQKDINEWLKRGDFVFHWDEEYFCNADGVIESS